MDAHFWLKRWENNEIGFHLNEPNPALVKHFNELSLPKNSRIFLPLCGKTLDIRWLLSNGYRVVGTELSKSAVKQLFTELQIEPKVLIIDKIAHYYNESIDIFVGDIFHLSQEILGNVDAVYDRAALVALPEKTRGEYVPHLMAITKKAPQLLITFEYDQSLMDGPPFSVDRRELTKRYSNIYNLTLLQNTDLAGGLRGKYPAKEAVWVLKN